MAQPLRRRDEVPRDRAPHDGRAHAQTQHQLQTLRGQPRRLLAGAAGAHGRPQAGHRAARGPIPDHEEAQLPARGRHRGLPGPLGPAPPAPGVRGVHLLPVQGHAGPALPARGGAGAARPAEARAGDLRVRRGEGRADTAARGQDGQLRHHRDLQVPVPVVRQGGGPVPGHLAVRVHHRGAPAAAEPGAAEQQHGGAGGGPGLGGGGGRGGGAQPRLPQHPLPLPRTRQRARRRRQPQEAAGESRGGHLPHQEGHQAEADRRRVPVHERGSSEAGPRHGDHDHQAS